MMDYTTAHRMIAHYQNQLLPQFADGWSRWPRNPTAERIATVIDAQREFYQGLAFVAQANDCLNLASALRQHASDS
mgnify:CR=1 FL=1